MKSSLTKVLAETNQKKKKEKRTKVQAEVQDWFNSGGFVCGIQGIKGTNLPAFCDC